MKPSGLPFIINVRKEKKIMSILKDVTQLIRFYVCFLKVIRLSPINLRTTRRLHDY